MKFIFHKYISIHIICIVFVLLFVLVQCIDFASAQDGFSAYRSNTGISATNSPKVRYWNNTQNTGNGSWSNEIELASSGSPIRYLVLKQSPVNSRMVLVTQSDDGNLDGYVCSKRCDNASYWTLTSNIANVGIASQRMFDMAFEHATGDLILVYAVVNANAANDIGYKILSNANSSFLGLTEQYINDDGHATDIQYTWIVMDAKPNSTSEEIIFAGFDSTDSDINAWVWNGTNFGTINSISEAATATSGYEALAVKYAADASICMVAGADGTSGTVNSEYWRSASWTTLASFDPITSGNGRNNVQLWLSMDANPTNDDLQLMSIDSGSRLHTAYWDGSTWSVTNVAAGVDSTASRVADFMWLNDGTGRLIYDQDSTGTTLRTIECNPSCTSAALDISTYAGTGAWISLFRNPANEMVKAIGLRLNGAFDIGSFWYNGTASDYVNYGDNTLTADTATTLYESFNFDFRRDVRPPSISLINPNASGIYWMNKSVNVNITANEYLASAILEWNGTNHTMEGMDSAWNFTITNLGAGFYSYRVYAFDLANNSNVSLTWNLTITAPNITLSSPNNNTLFNSTRNVTFSFNVTDISGDVDTCFLLIDGQSAANKTSINELFMQNITYTMPRGQHNWSVWCNDSNSINSSSFSRNVTSYVYTSVRYIYLDENMAPYGQMMLNAGSTRFLNCTIVVSDPDGPSFIKNASARFHFYLNRSDDSDDNNVHYTDTDCTAVNYTSFNKTFECAFDVFYFANNGTWVCNVSVDNSHVDNYNVSSTILPLYAVNVTNGIDFGGAESGKPSMNITANITNFGNMPINISLQGYAVALGDKVGMNCTDNTNITISNIKFSTNDTADFANKVSLDGNIQNLDFTISKQTGSVPIYNTTYWQIAPDYGSFNRICNGFIIFNALAP